MRNTSGIIATLIVVGIIVGLFFFVSGFVGNSGGKPCMCYGIETAKGCVGIRTLCEKPQSPLPLKNLKAK